MAAAWLERPDACRLQPMSSGLRKQRHRGGERRTECYKTKMCRRIVESGGCPQGDACPYAHNADELSADGSRGSDPCDASPVDWPVVTAWKRERYKTKLCRHMAERGNCPFRESELQHAKPPPARAAGQQSRPPPRWRHEPYKMHPHKDGGEQRAMPH